MTDAAERLPVPFELADAYAQDDRLKEVFSRYSQLDLKSMLKDLPSLQTPDNGGASFVDMVPKGKDFDETEALIVPMHYQAGWDPANKIRLLILSHSLDKPKRIIVFPNDTLREHSLNLDTKNYPIIHQGDFTPIAEQYFKTLDSLGIKKFQEIGYSQAGAVGATVLRRAASKGYFEIGNSGLIDPPNTFARSFRELEEAFIATKLSELNAAVEASGIPAFSQAEHAKRSEIGKELAHLAFYELRSEFEPNTSIKHGFTIPHFLDDVSAALGSAKDLHLLVVAPSNSRIMPPEMASNIEKHLEGFGERSKWLRVSGYGHEIGHNLIAYTLIAKMALRDSAELAQ